MHRIAVELELCFPCRLEHGSVLVLCAKDGVVRSPQMRCGDFRPDTDCQIAREMTGATN